MFSDAHPLTGRAVLWITLGAFGTIIGANVALAVYAVGTFPGLVVANSYVASQSFDAEARGQRALGWTTRVTRSGGQLTLSLTDAQGRTVRPATLKVMAARPTLAADDRPLPLVFDGTAYSGSADLAPGRWHIRIDATAADGTPFHLVRELTVEGRP